MHARASTPVTDRPTLASTTLARAPLAVVISSSDWAIAFDRACIYHHHQTDVPYTTQNNPTIMFKQTNKQNTHPRRVMVYAPRTLRHPHPPSFSTANQLNIRRSVDLDASDDDAATTRRRRGDDGRRRHR